MKFDLWLYLKGVLMGMADIVPGVSGGTIAFITGIYETLIETIKGFVPSFLSLLRHRSLTRFASEARLSFLLTLLLGIGTAVLTLSHLIIYLLTHYPVPLWAFFFGLILASVKIVANEVKLKDWVNGCGILVGVAVALLVSRATPAQLEPSLLVAFGSGAIAICAMILPGISGSFILVLLGAYSFILGAIKNLDLQVLLVFMAGCAVGILSIANLISWAFHRHRQIMLSVLTGFMLGALDKVWPWKEVLSYRLNSKGEQVPLLEQNVTPGQYELLTGSESQLVVAVFCALFAAVFVLGIEHISGRKTGD